MAQEQALKKEKKQKKHEIDMINGPILSRMLLFAFPLVCSNILQLLFNAADIIVVGRFGSENSLAAVGSTSSLINLLVNLFVGLAIGCNVLTARYQGARKESDVSETVHTSIALSIVSGIAMGIIGILVAALRCTGTDLDENAGGGAAAFHAVHADLFPRHAGDDDLQLRQCDPASKG